MFDLYYRIQPGTDDQPVVATGAAPLPASWTNISGIRHLSPAEIADLGFWRRVEEPRPPGAHVIGEDIAAEPETRTVRVSWRTAPSGQTAVEIDDAWRRLRDERTALLAASDWTQMPDAPLSDEQRVAWRAYRSALRDLPERVLDPLGEVAWPTSPEA